MPLDRIEDWDKILEPLKVGTHNPSEQIQKLDRNLTSKAARSGDHWHDNMLRLTGSWVAKGNTDEEIHVLAAAHILPGYTPEKTCREVQKMIDGARAKGFAPQTDEVHANRQPFLEHIANIELTAPPWLIEGLIEQRSVCQIFGEPGSGKSFMAIDAACSIASGKDFHGRQVVCGPVIYVAGEGRRGVVRRINAWAMAHSVKLNDMTLYVSRAAVGINNGNNLAELKVEIRGISEEFGSPSLIILDTLARNFGDGDENDTRDMTSFIAEVDKLNDEFNCASLIVHHAGHGEKGRARGSSALKGALDAEYKISKQDDRIRMSCTKMKDEDEPDPLLFYLISVDMGKDESGIPVGSAVLEFRGMATPESARLTENERLGVTTFKEAFAELGHSTLNLNPAQLHLEQWREVFYKRATQPKTDSKRTAFDRARRTLRNKGWLTVDNDVYTLTTRTPGQSPDKQDLDRGPLE
jgi:KaiC/GvpD/RAD55 family RecA-like ATPase